MVVVPAPPNTPLTANEMHRILFALHQRVTALENAAKKQGSAPLSYMI
jgi:hypothetical protein